jgi:hypothetical protein
MVFQRRLGQQRFLELDVAERINTVQTNTNKLATDALPAKKQSAQSWRKRSQVDADRRFHTFTANIY